MFYRLRNTIARFMAGRNGTDAFNLFLLAVYLLLWIVGLCFRGTRVQGIFYLLGLGVIAYTVFRTVSRNIAKRRQENARFLSVWRRVIPWFRFQFDRIRYIRTYRFRRCPYCKASLRLPIRRGKRTVTCSRCRSPFKAFFL